jgi:hypothetical protein
MTSLRRDTISLNHAQCVEIAKAGGEIPHSNGNGNFQCTALVKTPAGWSTRIVGSQGTGNQGWRVLVGETPANKAIVRKGKIQSLVRAGCPYQVAKVAIRHPYGMEVWAVVAELLELYMHVPLDDVRRFGKWAKDVCPEISLSYPRRESVLNILRDVAKQESARS